MLAEAPFPAAWYLWTGQRQISRPALIFRTCQINTGAGLSVKPEAIHGIVIYRDTLALYLNARTRSIV